MTLEKVKTLSDALEFYKTKEHRGVEFEILLPNGEKGELFCESQGLTKVGFGQLESFEKRVFSDIGVVGQYFDKDKRSEVLVKAIN